MDASSPRERIRLVVGMSGSSAPQLGVTLLERLRLIDCVETHFAMSQGAKLSAKLEADLGPEEIEALADVSYDARNLGAAISSGSFLTTAWS